MKHDTLYTLLLLLPDQIAVLCKLCAVCLLSEQRGHIAVKFQAKQQGGF